MNNIRSTLARHLRKFSFLLLVMAPLLSASCSEDQFWLEFEDLFGEGKDDKAIPAEIRFTKEGLYPEGVSHDSTHERFLITSLRFGTIGQVGYDGTYTPFIQDDRLISTIGLKVDEVRKRVLVAVSDPGAGIGTTPETAGQLAALGIYDLMTGKRIHFVDLGTLKPGLSHFANDIALDSLGNAYVTDSFSPLIYKVDVEGNASVFFEEEAFATDSGEIGFNGIAYHPDGYLLVAFSKTNKVYRIPVNNTADYQEVQLTAALIAPDGLLLSKDGQQLIVVNNAGGQAPGKVVSFTSNDTWATGMAKETFMTEPIFPTTATGHQREVFVLYAHLNKLFSGTQPPVSKFTIRKVPFEGNQLF